MTRYRSPFGNFKWIAVWWILLWALWCLLAYSCLSIIWCISKLVTRFKP